MHTIDPESDGKDRGDAAAHRRGLFWLPSEVGALPHAWLAFLGFYFIGFFYQKPGSWQMWASIAGLLIFLPAYYSAFRCQDRAIMKPLAIIVALGAVLSPINPGANVFLQYAAFFAGQATAPRRAALIVAFICLIIVANTLLFDLGSYYWAPGIIVCIGLLGISINVRQQELANSALRRSQEEVQRLAKLAERERIARDLHDVVGHALSLITLKSELAARLCETDAAACRRELGDIERASRQALADVRATVSGYRRVGLPEEIDTARDALAAAGVAFQSAIEDVDLLPRQETLVAMLLREAVTNVVRHANARECRVDLHGADGHVVLRVSDNGSGYAGGEGQGLTGMRERLTVLGGTLVVKNDNGTTLTARIPLEVAA